MAHRQTRNTHRGRGAFSRTAEPDSPLDSDVEIEELEALEESETPEHSVVPSRNHPENVPRRTEIVSFRNAAAGVIHFMTCPFCRRIPPADAMHYVCKDGHVLCTSCGDRLPCCTYEYTDGCICRRPIAKIKPPEIFSVIARALSAETKPKVNVSDIETVSTPEEASSLIPEEKSAEDIPNVELNTVVNVPEEISTASIETEVEKILSIEPVLEEERKSATKVTVADIDENPQVDVDAVVNVPGDEPKAIPSLIEADTVIENQQVETSSPSPVEKSAEDIPNVELNTVVNVPEEISTASIETEVEKILGIEPVLEEERKSATKVTVADIDENPQVDVDAEVNAPEDEPKPAPSPTSEMNDNPQVEAAAVVVNAPGDEPKPIPSLVEADTVTENQQVETSSVVHPPEEEPKPAPKMNENPLVEAAAVVVIPPKPPTANSALIERMIRMEEMMAALLAMKLAEGASK